MGDSHGDEDGKSEEDEQQQHHQQQQQQEHSQKRNAVLHKVMEAWWYAKAAYVTRLVQKQALGPQRLTLLQSANILLLVSKTGCRWPF